MTYGIELTPAAETDLHRLDAAVMRRVIAKLRWLSENIEIIKLEALTGNRQGIFKLRVGNYRVFYTRETVKRQIVVHYIRHRSEAYKSAFSDRKKSMKKTNGLE